MTVKDNTSKIHCQKVQFTMAGLTAYYRYESFDYY